MYLDYDHPEYSVHLRESLPASVKKTLLESTRAEWKDHPRFGGKANFFMTIHRDLLNGAAQLTHSVEQLLDVPINAVSKAVEHACKYFAIQ